MSSLPKIEIHLTGTGAGSYVKIDGFLVPGVRDIGIEQGLGDVPTLRLELVSDNITVTGDARLAMEVYDPSPAHIERIAEAVTAHINDVARSSRRNARNG